MIPRRLHHTEQLPKQADHPRARSQRLHRLGAGFLRVWADGTSCPLAPVAHPPHLRRKWAAPRAVLARPSRSRDISTSPVPAQWPQRVIRPGHSRGGALPPWPVHRSRFESRSMVRGDQLAASEQPVEVLRELGVHPGRQSVRQVHEDRLVESKRTRLGSYV